MNYSNLEGTSCDSLIFDLLLVTIIKSRVCYEEWIPFDHNPARSELVAVGGFPFASASCDTFLPELDRIVGHIFTRGAPSSSPSRLAGAFPAWYMFAPQGMTC
jgi:hypothetical protein